MQWTKNGLFYSWLWNNCVSPCQKEKKKNLETPHHNKLKMDHRHECKAQTRNVL